MMKAIHSYWAYLVLAVLTITVANGSEVMGDAAIRLLAIEHPVMMILATIFITIGWSKHKKKTEDDKKFKTFAIFYGIGLLLILSKIPWNQWPSI